MFCKVSWDVIGGMSLYITLLVMCLFLGWLGTLVIPPAYLFNIYTVDLVFMASPFFVVSFIQNIEKQDFSGTK